MTKKMNELKMKLDMSRGSLDLGFNNEVINIELISYNPAFYNSAEAVLQSYGILITYYIQYQQRLNKKIDLLEFLKYSIENNPDICDFIKEDYNFEVKGTSIISSKEDDHVILNNFGEFNIENYAVYSCSSYMFIEDMRTQKKYMYYGD